METCKNHMNKCTQLINIDGKLTTNLQSIAKSFNNLFVTVADKISKLNSVALVRERTIPTERPPPVGEVSANFCG